MPHRQNDRPAAELYLGDGERVDIMGANGLPQVHLVEQVYGGARILRFCDDLTGKLMKAEARRLSTVGIWAGKLRGVSHYAAAARRSDLRPGRLLVLVRERDNPHDPNAVGVRAADSDEVVGYVNKAKARQLARQLDAGIHVVAVSLDGTAAGRACTGVTYAAAQPTLLAHLMGPRPITAAKPAHWAD
ncbi:HIRAN domain-containing protein [Segeticoccus rhizosphaerae]|uniref:HIRAN domain-containing protein n=1 Tax=Segeticoccus rhizosphaerae TaxID=1104777 RepID=UPI0013969679|nr:HIRAN domain-containing protein [Segeticoccus rhizosphaerae]